MALPSYLTNSHFHTRADYKWSRLISNGFVAVPGERYPKLWDTLKKNSIRANFALSLACSEWIAARLQHLTDISDALLRIEAGWAATIDWRYPTLPKPVSPPRSASGPDPIGEPLHMAGRFLTYLHGYYVKTYQGVPNQGVLVTALQMALIARHITPKKAGFDKWLTASMSKAKANYPAKKVPVQKEKPVPPEFFYPDFKWSADAVTVSQARFLATLRPSRNPYLRKPAQLKADGFKGEPYPK